MLEKEHKPDARNIPQCSRICMLEETALKVPNASPLDVIMTTREKTQTRKYVLAEKKKIRASRVKIAMHLTTVIKHETFLTIHNASSY